MALLIRNRLAVRIAGSHPADRGSIPRYGSNVMVSDTVGPRDSYATNLFSLAPIAAHPMFWLLPLPLRLGQSSPAECGNGMVSDAVGPRDSNATILFCLAPFGAHSM